MPGMLLEYSTTSYIRQGPSVWDPNDSVMKAGAETRPSLADRAGSPRTRYSRRGGGAKDRPACAEALRGDRGECRQGGPMHGPKAEHGAPDPRQGAAGDRVEGRWGLRSLRTLGRMGCSRGTMWMVRVSGKMFRDVFWEKFVCRGEKSLNTKARIKEGKSPRSFRH